MCTAANCPRRHIPGIDFFSLMAHRLVSEGGLIPEATVRERWCLQGRAPHELGDCLRKGSLRGIARASQRWLPAFQFQADGCTPREDVARVADELKGAMDASEILAWFACGNSALGDETPLMRLRTDLAGVLEAARLDSFICSA